MISEINSEISDLIDRLRQMQDKADALMIHQHDLKEQLKTVELMARESPQVTDSENDSGVFDLIQRLRQMHDKADALAEYQFDLREQLQTAEKKALEVHQKLVEEECDVGGEG